MATHDRRVMVAWLILVAIIIVCLTILMYTRYHKEGYMNSNLANSFHFANDNTVAFQKSGNEGILTNPGLNLWSLNDALRQPDIYLHTKTDQDYKPFFVADPENAFTEKDFAFCKKALHPNYLPKRENRSVIGCGWWFHPTQVSVGVLGNADGPVVTKGLPGGGEYIWNLADAAEKEDFKKCKRIGKCDLIDTPGIKGSCGWCDRLGHAVPITTAGFEKYPNTTVDNACGEKLIKSEDSCPKPPPPPVTTPDGEDCGQYGRPSPDNKIRHYTPDECMALGGNSSGNECLKPQGGSYSWDCRALNKPIAERPKPVTVCTPDARGRISRDCLIETALGLGLAKQGSIYKMLNTTNSPNNNEKLAIKYLANVGVEVPNSILGDGNIEKNDAAALYMKIYNTMAAGKTERVRQSAKLLAVGTSEFDPCTVEGSDIGPFELECVQRAFRVAGCQPGGKMAPTARSVTELSSMTWNQINKKFSDLHDLTNNADPEVQDKAMDDCLGFKFGRVEPKKCDTLPTSYIPAQTTIIGKADMTGDYVLSFNITPTGVVGNWANIVRFQQAPGGLGDCCNFGARSPAIWFFPGALNLHIRIGDRTDGNWGINTDPIPLGQTSSVRIECIGRSVKVIVNGRLYQDTQPTYRFYGNMIVYGSDPFYPAAQARVSAFSYTIGSGRATQPAAAPSPSLAAAAAPAPRSSTDIAPSRPAPPPTPPPAPRPSPPTAPGNAASGAPAAVAAAALNATKKAAEANAAKVAASAAAAKAAAENSAAAVAAAKAAAQAAAVKAAAANAAAKQKAAAEAAQRALMARLPKPNFQLPKLQMPFFGRRR